MSRYIEKTDGKLGQQVHEHLVKLGLETPMTEKVHGDLQNKRAVIEKAVYDIMDVLGLDMKDDSLIDTPRRVAKMYTSEIFYGLDYNEFPKCTQIDNKMSAENEFVLERNVTIQSNCEHHLVVIDGLATIAYIPRKNVLGLSKLNRIAAFFAKRPQVQERLTNQIMEAIKFITQSDDVAVYIDAVHYCVKSRGVEDTNSSTVTLACSGVFAEVVSDVRREFLNLARMK